jgi:hypothetical protein
MRRLLTAIPFALALGAGAAQAQVFSTGNGNGLGSFPSGVGIGQGISVGTETRLSQLGFWIGVGDPVIGVTNGAGVGQARPLRADARVKFMIWNADNSTLLYSQSRVVGDVDANTLVLSDPFALTLHAGSTYFVGVVADNQLFFNYLESPGPLTQNGVSLAGGFTSYDGFDTPVHVGPGKVDPTRVAVAFELRGTQVTAAPEPATGVLAAGGGGLLALVVIARRRR